MDKRIYEILGPEAEDLSNHRCATISWDMLHLLGPAFLDDIVALTDRSPRVLRSLQAVFDHGRLAGTGLITGRKAFQRPMKEGIALLNAVQDVYLDRDITVA